MQTIVGSWWYTNGADDGYSSWELLLVLISYHKWISHICLYRLVRRRLENIKSAYVTFMGCLRGDWIAPDPASRSKAGVPFGLHEAKTKQWKFHEQANRLIFHSRPTHDGTGYYMTYIYYQSAEWVFQVLSALQTPPYTILRCPCMATQLHN